MQIGYETVRANLITKVEALKGKNADLDAVIDKYLETKNNTKANDAPPKQGPDRCSGSLRLR